MRGQQGGVRFYARGFGIGCLGTAVMLALFVGVVVSGMGAAPQRVATASVVFAVAVGIWLVAFGVAFLLAPYVEIQSDRLITRSLGIRRVQAFDGVGRLERRTGALRLLDPQTDRPKAQVLTIILDASSTDFETALQDALRAHGPAAPPR